MAMHKSEKLNELGQKLLLFDVYGGLLTEKQQQALALTYNEDYSLGEIASMLNVSRQAVFDSVRRSEELLQSYEAKLGLIGRNRREAKLLEQLTQAEKQADWRQVAAVREALARELRD